VANSYGCRDRPHRNRACCGSTTKEPLSERKTNTQWLVPDPRFRVHEACVLVGIRGETFLAGERGDNSRPLTAFCIVWKENWGAPSSSAGARGIVQFICFCQTGKEGVLLQQTEPEQRAFTHHLCPAHVRIIHQPAIPPSGGRDVSIRSSIAADGRFHVAVELFVGYHLLDRAYLQRGNGGPSTSLHNGSGDFFICW